jgi:hypothetical protein
MKRYMNKVLLLLLLSALPGILQAQDSGFAIGSADSLFNVLEVKSSRNARVVKEPLKLRVSESKSFAAEVNFQESSVTTQSVMGELSGHKTSSFYLKVSKDKVEGHIILRAEKTAFRYEMLKGKVFVKEVDIHDLLCIELEETPAEIQQLIVPSAEAIAPALLNLQSLPGAAGCILLDFDGHNMPAGNLWNGGNPINAAPSGMSDEAVQEHWEIVAEDFRPFNLNITTSEAVFNSYPRNRRMRCVITPTNTAAPGAGGVAYIGSFNWDNDVPCWVFITSGKAGGEASSHEIGHTFGLGHDGRTSPVEGYFSGHGDWAPIMGVGYYKPVSQWSKGEYTNANNTEDDLAKIAGSNYGLGYRNDDHSNTRTNATAFKTNTGGQLNTNQNAGIIERTNDLDFFTFSTSGGQVSLNASTVSRHGNLDIIMRVYNGNGEIIGTYYQAGLTASCNLTVAAGTYYVSIDGMGVGNPLTDGYSDYASLGTFYINGSVPPLLPSTNAVATFYKDCNYGGYAVGLEVGDYTIAQLQAMGIVNDDISSLRVIEGYKVTLFTENSFVGTNKTFTTADDCLVNDGLNDVVSSVRIRPNGVSAKNGKYFLQNVNSSLYMDLANFNPNDGGNLLQWNYTGATNQQFQFDELGDGVYKITVVSSSKVMEVAAVSKENGANVRQWTYVASPNQQFILFDAGEGNYKLIARHSQKVVEIADGSVAVNANAQQWDNNNQRTSLWKLNAVPNANFTQFIEAESYSAMNGIQTEATTDAGGGQNVGWIDAGDWLVYPNITFPTSGNYRVEYRVAGFGGRLSLDLNAGLIQLGSREIPSTGGWQTWTTISQTVYVNAGTYNLGLFGAVSGWNINWLRITQVSGGRQVANASNSSTSSIVALEAYPNPAQDFITIDVPTDMENSKVLITDAAGNPIKETTLQGKVLDISELAAGIYIVWIESNGERSPVRIVKQ